MFSQYHPFAPYCCKNITSTQKLTQRLYSIPTSPDEYSYIAIRTLLKVNDDHETSQPINTDHEVIT